MPGAQSPKAIGSTHVQMRLACPLPHSSATFPSIPEDGDRHERNQAWTSTLRFIAVAADDAVGFLFPLGLCSKLRAITLNRISIIFVFCILTQILVKFPSLCSYLQSSHVSFPECED